jgi:hypothetical protein
MRPYLSDSIRSENHRLSLVGNGLGRVERRSNLVCGGLGDGVSNNGSPVRLLAGSSNREEVLELVIIFPFREVKLDYLWIYGNWNRIFDAVGRYGIVRLLRFIMRLRISGASMCYSYQKSSKGSAVNAHFEVGKSGR